MFLYEFVIMLQFAAESECDEAIYEIFTNVYLQL